MKFYYVTNIFKIFEISAEMHFVSLFFLNERNITASFLMMHLKCSKFKLHK